MKMSVGTTAALVDTSSYPDLGSAGQVVVLQNLGPGDVYVDFKPGVTAATGVKISANGAYEFPRASNQSLYIVASEVSDVRVMAVG